MWRILSVAAVAMTLAVPAWADPGTVSGLSPSGSLSVRTGPGTHFPRVGHLRNGDAVEIIGSQGPWYHIQAHGVDGWSSSDWIRPGGGPAPAPAPQGGHGPDHNQPGQPGQPGQHRP